MTAYAPGVPSWVDLASPDVSASKAFYGGLLGWTTQESDDPDAMGYTTFLKNGKTVAGVGPVMAEGQPPVWTTYIATNDANETAARVEKANGRVVAGPMDVMSHGRMAVFIDPTGATFATWQAGDNTGADLTNDMGAMCWSELATREPAMAKTFYHEVFGWHTRDLPMGPTEYTLMKMGDDSVAGMMPMTDQFPADTPPHWTPYFAVEDPDQVSSMARTLGGHVLLEPMDMQAGRFSVLSDPHGASFSVIKPDENYNP